MKARITFFVLLLTGISIFSFRIKQVAKKNTVSIKKQMLEKRKVALRCSPDLNELVFTPEEVNNLGPLPGWGKYTWKISTKSDSAQYYFNQGINMYYGFHIIEALASFKKAQWFDKNCAMLYWAEALSYGPNINDLGYNASPAALTAIEKAKELSTTANAIERKLINAQNIRYSTDSSVTRKQLNEMYSASMQKLFAIHNTNADIAALYTDALMNEHPWDYWFINGKAKAWTPLIISTISKGLKINNNHPGLNHYNIHIWEASATPGKAMSSANKLGMLTPGLSHMVHMPSHIYIRTGDFKKGIKVNEAAIKQYYTYQKLFPDVTANAALYEIHNFHMQAANALFTEDYNYAINSASLCRKSVDSAFLFAEAPIGGYAQYMWSTPVLTMVYYEKWDNILKIPEPPASLHYASLLWHFARGMAFAFTNKNIEAIAERDEMKKYTVYEDMKIPLGVFNSPNAAAGVAIQILSGIMAEMNNEKDNAIAYLEEAVKKEDAMVYNEPKDWLTPARQYLGYTYLKFKNYTKAVEVFTASLKKDPGEPYCIEGLKIAREKK